MSSISKLFECSGIVELISFQEAPVFPNSRDRSMQSQFIRDAQQDYVYELRLSKLFSSNVKTLS